MSRRHFGWQLATAACLLLSAGAQGATIQTTQISASTLLGQYVYFSIDQVHDGIVSDAPPYNGYASGFGVVSGRITLTLDQAYDLDSFSLWNDINIADQGVRSFTLSFENAGGSTLATTPVYNAVSQFAPQVYSFATVVGVKRVQLDVISSSLQIEIREVAFDGTVSVVPEPGALALMLAGLGVVGLVGGRARRRHQR
ncbi:MAG: PEP-CTERM sorting domain-containing protein [Rubrivivax sp.]|jgi:hypothetical protein|nr:PEP-CTERM sorting domain-containing protein [Rubrivivax sp.]